MAAAHSAYARPAHNAATPVTASLGFSGAESDSRYPSLTRQQPVAASTAARRHVRARTIAVADTSAIAGPTSSPLVAEARRYLGTNPTGRRSAWCGAFMDMVLKHTGHPGGGNLALAYSRYGTRVTGPQVGAIAVMGRRGGGHVGVVSGVDANGNPIIVSGNHNRTVAEAVYPRRRIIAYVMPRG
jgi:uncharacterized protein (TIGR02594 family)